MPRATYCLLIFFGLNNFSSALLLMDIGLEVEVGIGFQFDFSTSTFLIYEIQMIEYCEYCIAS